MGCWSLLLVLHLAGVHGVDPILIRGNFQGQGRDAKRWKIACKRKLSRPKKGAANCGGASLAQPIHCQDPSRLVPLCAIKAERLLVDWQRGLAA